MPSKKTDTNPEKKGTTPRKKTVNRKGQAGDSQTGNFYIVGIGASAGGLEAFERFFQNMPDHSGMAFILVPHLDPSHASLMPALIQKSSPMNVIQVKDGTRVMPDSIYIVPPNHYLALLKGTLQLMDPPQFSSPRMPIDYFFRSLAQDRGNKAICIILSGMGSDGTMGMRAVKGEMGLAMAQSPDSAKYDSMPRSAIETELVDFTLPPEDMPAQLMAYAKYALKIIPSNLNPMDKTIPDALKKIFILLRTHTGHDFSSYKKNTIYRRIERRMNIHQISKISTYVRYLQENQGEVMTLFKELLIGVTNFFRDTEAFNILNETAIPRIMKSKQPDSPIRIWVPGCSTGEEAYSIAILLREYAEKLQEKFSVQIFATDIDSSSIETARIGAYPGSISSDVSEERLKRFFVAEGTMYRIRKDIREMLVFAPQDIIKDPPFTKLDMISCRNMLIYLDSDLQKKIIPLFHYSLRPGGVLFLGSAESVGGFTDLFSVIEKKWKIFKRSESKSNVHLALEFPLSRQVVAYKTGEKQPTEVNIAELADKTLLAAYAPPSVIINGSGDILYIHGRTGMYLEPAPGEAKLNILEMVREGLKMDISAAIRRVKTQKKAQTYKGLQVKNNGSSITVDVLVRPIGRPDMGKELFLVVFEEAAPVQDSANLKPKAGRRNESSRIITLEKELLLSRENLQSTIEELETINEELKSANEELQSTNEELQSTNEELETSKEEQQSLNEELTTVNSELQGKIDELVTSNNDMKNLLNSVNMPTIFLDMDLCIKRFTSNAIRVINLIETDIGRPLSDLVIKLKYDTIIDDAREVLRDLVYREREVETVDGEWFAIKILPYRTLDNVIEGIVITFQDLGERKKIEKALNENMKQFNEVQQIAGIGSWSWLLDSDKVEWSEELYRIAGREPKQPPLNLIKDLSLYTEKSRELNKIAAEKIFATGEPFEIELELLLTDGEAKKVLVRHKTARDVNGRIFRIYGTIQDIQRK